MSAQEMRRKHTVFIFIDATPGKDKAVLEKVLKYDEVIEVHLISGQYDLLAVLEFKRAYFTSVQELAQKLIEKIRKLSGVRDTSTIVPFFSVTKRGE